MQIKLRRVRNHGLGYVVGLVTVTMLSFPSLGQAEPQFQVKKQGNTTNYEASGNLEVTHKLECLPSSKLSNEYTAADLYHGLSKCLEKEDYKDAAFLFAIAGAYARFDQLRVADESARQAATVLRMNYFDPFSKENKMTLMGVLKQDLGSPDGLAATCKEVRRIGIPNYYPRYMIQHGLGAFGKDAGADGLIKDFNSNKGFEEALSSYLHCPQK
ncbi:MAG: hypothetical protein K1X79_00910 [Oligoflexia bacterium]|nr:hypothetical protein [Oligoflexia bacterium]